MNNKDTIYAARFSKYDYDGRVTNTRILGAFLEEKLAQEFVIDKENQLNTEGRRDDWFITIYEVEVTQD